MLLAYATGAGLSGFNVAEYRPPAEDTDAEYPLMLTTGRVISQVLSGTQTRRIGPLVDQYPEPRVELHPRLAERLGISLGAATLLGAAAGGIWQGADKLGRRIWGRIQGYQELGVDDAVLPVAVVYDAEGRPKETLPGRGFHTSIFADLFAALGPLAGRARKARRCLAASWVSPRLSRRKATP